MTDATEPEQPPTSAPPRRLTRAERAAENSRAWQEKRRAELDALTQAAERAKTGTMRRGTGEPTADDTPARARAREECPDPFAPDAPRKLFAAAFRRVWDLVQDREATNIDVLAAFDKARLAAGIGKEDAPPEEYHLPMESVFGSGASAGDGPGGQSQEDAKEPEPPAESAPPE